MVTCFKFLNSNPSSFEPEYEACPRTVFEDSDLWKPNSCASRSEGFQMRLMEDHGAVVQSGSGLDIYTAMAASAKNTKWVTVKEFKLND